jgi:adenosylcobinamide kinase/adenosylcobinamide-phosphate guanylyltransferase
MRHIVLVTGGQRSGKSRFAQQLAEQSATHPVYLATARLWDEDFAARVQRHREDRGPNWETVEEQRHLGALCLDGRVVLLDCVTLWLTNIFHENGFCTEPALQEAKREWDQFAARDNRLIVVSNELGMGLHGANEVSRHFADLQGWMNQHIAASADEVYLMVSGIPVKIK